MNFLVSNIFKSSMLVNHWSLNNNIKAENETSQGRGTF